MLSQDTQHATNPEFAIMMDIQRNAILAGIFAILFLLLLQWNKFQNLHSNPNTPPAEASSVADTSKKGSPDVSADIPELPAHTNSSTHTAADSGSDSTGNNKIFVVTDVLIATIDLHGGDIIGMKLPAYPSDLGEKSQPTEILTQNGDHIYIAQSGLIGDNGTDVDGQRPHFTSEATQYSLSPYGNEVQVNLVAEERGIKITKQFVFRRGDYLVDVNYLIDNKQSSAWHGSFFGQIKRSGFVPTSKSSGLRPFLGAATTTTEAHYKKQTLKDIEKSPLHEVNTGGWIAFVQHYFISAWIAPATESNTFTTRKLSQQDIYIVGYTGEEKTIAAGAQGKISARLYVGPKITPRLEQISAYLDLTVDYGWLWWVAKPLHWVLQKSFLVVHNWGWSIILLTVIIKIMLFPLSQKAYTSMAAMRKVAPKMNSIREQFGDNRQKLQEEMLKLYRTENINPLGGCLPMLIQMPVFISLYWVLMESVELRQAPFLLWVKDLSTMDPYFVLPILMGISMYLQQKMNPAPPDPMQARVMQFLPIVFTFMFLWFPAGLVLYWLVNNVTSMIHQAIINKQQEASS